jgi:hypothetical protein
VGVVRLRSFRGDGVGEFQVLDTGAPRGLNHSQGRRNQSSQDDRKKHGLPFLGSLTEESMTHHRSGLVVSDGSARLELLKEMPHF